MVEKTASLEKEIESFKLTIKENNSKIETIEKEVKEKNNTIKNLEEDKHELEEENNKKDVRLVLVNTELEQTKTQKKENEDRL